MADDLDEDEGPEQPIIKTLAPVELDTYEKALLYLICQQGRYHSSVYLAADYYEATVGVQESRVLEWNLVQLVLADMNEKGLVTYRLGAYDVFVHIRPTRKAYEVSKVAFKWMRQVGTTTNRYDRPVHEGDLTDFRSHSEQSVGGVVVKEDFIDHCFDCDHIAKHRAQLRELYGSDEL